MRIGNFAVPLQALEALEGLDSLELTLNFKFLTLNDNGPSMWNRGTAQCGQVYAV